MIWILSATLAFAQFSASDKTSEKGSSKEDATPKCSFDSSTSPFLFPDDPLKGKLLIFTSFSVPTETWKEHSCHLEKMKGAFVLRGLPNNSFEELQKKILALRKAGIKAEILLDPETFEKYEINSVPAIILTSPTAYDKAVGNVHIPYVLTLFSETGDTKEQALQLLKEGLQ